MSNERSNKEVSVVVSPCIGVCLLDERDLCVGCRRTMSEISNWSVYTDDRRQEILTELDER